MIQFDYFSIGLVQPPTRFWGALNSAVSFHTFPHKLFCGFEDLWQLIPPTTILNPPPCKSWRLIYSMTIFTISAVVHQIFVLSIVYLHTYIHACMHAYILTYIHTYIPTYLHTYIPTYLHTYIHTCIHTYIHTYNIHTYIHTYIHSFIHTYIHTYIRNYRRCKFFHMPLIKKNKKTGDLQNSSIYIYMSPHKETNWYVDAILFSNKVLIDAGIGNWTLTTAKVSEKNPSPFLPYQIPSLQEDSPRPLEDTPDPQLRYPPGN